MDHEEIVAVVRKLHNLHAAQDEEFEKLRKESCCATAALQTPANAPDLIDKTETIDSIAKIIEDRFDDSEDAL